MAEEQKDGTIENIIDTMGEAMIDAVGAAGETLHDAAAKVVDLAGDAVDSASDFIDDVTENGPLKEFGDRVGEAGREAAERIERKADEMEENDDPASV